MSQFRIGDRVFITIAEAGTSQVPYLHKTGVIIHFFEDVAQVKFDDRTSVFFYSHKFIHDITHNSPLIQELA